MEKRPSVERPDMEKRPSVDRPGMEKRPSVERPNIEKRASGERPDDMLDRSILDHQERLGGLLDPPRALKSEEDVAVNAIRVAVKDDQRRSDVEKRSSVERTDVEKRNDVEKRSSVERTDVERRNEVEKRSSVERPDVERRNDVEQRPSVERPHLERRSSGGRSDVERSTRPATADRRTGSRVREDKETL